MEKKTTKIKGWIKEHKDQLIGVGVVAGVVAVYAGLIAAAVAADKKNVAKQQDTMRELADAAGQGALILPSPTGYWIINGPEAG